MKIILTCFMSVLLFFSQVYSVSATEVDQKCVENVYEIGTPVTPDGYSIESIIRNSFSQSDVDALFSSNPECCPDSYYVNLSIYAVEYTVSVNNQANKQLSLMIHPQIEILSKYPVIYVPIFGSINGNERIVGHVKFYYNTFKGEYTDIPVMMNSRSGAFLSGTVSHFLEELGITNGYTPIINAANQYNVVSLALVRFSGALNDFSEKLVLINTENSGLITYDFMNSLHLSEDKECTLMSIDEYVTQRVAYETSCESNEGQFKGGHSSKTDTANILDRIAWFLDSYFLQVCVLVLLFGVGGFALIWYKRKK